MITKQTILQDIRLLITFIFGCLPASLVALFAAPYLVFNSFGEGYILGVAWGLAAALGTLGLWSALPPIRSFRPITVCFLSLGLAAALPTVTWFPLMLFPAGVAILNLSWFLATAIHNLFFIT